MGLKIVYEKEEKIDVPKVKFRTSDYNTSAEANMFNDLMFIEGAISKQDYQRNARKIRDTAGVFRYVRW